MSEQRNEVDVAWAAGLFEGEGCFSTHLHNSRRKQVRATLGMTDKDAVERFAAIIGFGQIYICHSPSDRRKGWKPLYRWGIFEAAKVRELIALFMPYLCDRRRAKALEVLDFADCIGIHPGSRTHCPQGHPLSGENLVFERSHGKLIRRCVVCRRKQSRDKMRKRLGVKPENYRVKED